MPKRKTAKPRKRRKPSPPKKAKKAPRTGRTRSIVGDLVNFRGLVYAPINETGVVFLFGKVAADLNTGRSGSGLE